jgi:amino acid transporter
VLVISACYSRTIEQFPHGGGAYVVASKMLGAGAGAVAGTALLVDYVLTITVSIAAAGDALFSLLHVTWHDAKLGIEIATIVTLVVLNMRGVRESVLALVPLFLVFLVTHAIVIAGGIAVGFAHVKTLPQELAQGFSAGRESMGFGGLALLVLYAYSLGGGTYTGIEAVSNGVPILREPRVENAKRTMLYMACSLAFTAAGLLLCYLVLDVRAVEGKTLNAVLVETFVTHVPVLGGWFVMITVLSEAALLFVASQTGFIDGPRVMANLAQDSWIPHRFAALSDRLSIHNGILLMGGASLGALLYTGGSVQMLVVMYSINVFLTFLLSMLGMCRFWIVHRNEEQAWLRNLLLYVAGTMLCATILVITVLEKFRAGGWMTLLVTSILLAVCIVIRRYYRTVEAKLAQLDRLLGDLHLEPTPRSDVPDRNAATAAILVTRYGGLGTHTVLNVLRLVQGYFKNMLFISVGVVDTGNFKGRLELHQLEEETKANLDRYVRFGRALGMHSEARYAIGADAVTEVEKLCTAVAADFPHTVFFAGQLIFQRERWYHRLLHNQTAFSIQKRLHWAGLPMIVLPVRVLE